MLYGPEYESGKLGSLTPDPPRPEATRCGSCGQSVAELEPCTWDTRLKVGPCCRFHSDEYPELVFGRPATVPALVGISPAAGPRIAFIGNGLYIRTRRAS